MTLPRLLLAGLLALPGALHALDYPTKPVRIVVPFQPGGGSDALARLLDDPPLLESMGQAGLARVRQSLSWQAVAERTRNCLRG